MGEKLVLPLDAAEADLPTVGGKGASLAKLARAGLPVPPGFHVTTSATNHPEAEQAIRKAYQGMGAVAVRSSATAEDLPGLSFAGQQDSFLNVTGADEVVEAVRKCWASLYNERAVDYRRRNGIEHAEIAVVVQEFVPADAAGVMFTVNPVSGADETVINAGRGVGEALVGGEVTPDVYVLKHGKEIQRQGDTLTKRQTNALSKLGARIQRLYGMPMDIEWVLHKGRFAIVQARPVTGLKEEWNDSVMGDFLWTSVNLGEAVPSVMTPMTWSLVRVLSQQASIGGFPVTGNIGGRFYLNLSVAGAIRKPDEQLLGMMPETPPKLPVSKLRILADLIRSAPPLIKQAITYRRHLGELIEETPKRCESLISQIKKATSTKQLRALWPHDLLYGTARTLDAGARMVTQPKIANEIRRLVGEADTVTLLTGLGELASLGPLLGEAGHRCPDEFEVSVARPAEDPGWIGRPHEGAEELLRNQRKARDEVWQRLRNRYPRRAKRIERHLAKAAERARDRENARSEMVRTFWVFRAFVLRAQELTGHDDLFFLSIDELLDMLETGNRPDTAQRRETYERYRELPVYPPFIRGHFDPVAWAANPRIYDETGDPITGFPGVSGVVEGIARVTSTVDELQQGEILVTTVTNVGWTPVFPKAAAVVTDVGAPLSHAAIVARELGIPAVVGCGDATARIRTGDRVRVDGGRGTVTVLS
ncbi:hypothetical protein Lesp02_15960 [Lentzea sp. NBRC 105346]|uniref:PEP/pyruvate-binding domain-containing protein n=1 Tax=Lentzea sp. NBRC 105346 TaxID=3032205 RepID=UPI0024A296E3|nr:PEP/pyruvate-binding domain-containing protein [Lentzea sp. NBRC 105346]GLZ29406.1 hypothetical protein Lesp02_15960 [Lentzea sp. NBRC 105346]